MAALVAAGDGPGLLRRLSRYRARAMAARPDEGAALWPWNELYRAAMGAIALVGVDGLEEYVVDERGIPPGVWRAIVAAAATQEAREAREHLNAPESEWTRWQAACLRQALLSANPYERWRAVESITIVAERRLLPELEALLGDADPHVQAATKRAIEALTSE
jgi:hypothetical protein